VTGKNVQITVRENVTQRCPNVKADLADENSVQFSFEPEPGSSPTGADTLTVVEKSGRSRTISFPGCYRVVLTFRLKTPVVNPYIEAFIQMGTNIPCHQESSTSQSSNICTNITQTNWCPLSNDPQLRSLLAGKQTCRFCNLCEQAKESKKKNNGEVSKLIQIDDRLNDQCNSDKDRQTLHFRMCTPDKKELQKKNQENEDKIEEYWKYLKQGVLTAVIHVVDRAPVDKMAQCRTLCQTMTGQKSVSASYRQTLLNSITGLCTPKDKYAACVYHTMKFDVNGDIH